MNPEFPIFIPTKGRYKTPYTIRALERISVPFTAVVEKQEYEQYAEVVGKERLLVLPHQNQGLTVTRNWIWDYAVSLGTPYFWTFDDNIVNIWRWNKNRKLKVDCPTPLRVIEDFTERYENAYISGMYYFMFINQK